MLKYYNELVYYIQKMIGDKEQAIDIIQETYTKTIERSKNSDIKNERAFLYRVAKNIVIDQARKNKKVSHVEYEEESYTIPLKEQPEELLFQSVEQELLLEALYSLPKQQKQVFVLHVFDGLSKKKIAEIMNLNLNTVQKYTISATQKLTKYIEEKQ